MKKIKDEITLNPITGWSFHSIPTYDAIYLELYYLSHALQKPDEATLSPKFLFQAGQLRELQQAIGRILHQHEAIGFQPPPPDQVQ